MATIACTAVGYPLTAQVTSPAQGTVVTPGQVVTIQASVSGAVAGISQITLSGQRDADGFNDVYGYGPFPPTNNANVSGSYTIPLDATNGENLSISVNAQGYGDDPANHSITVTASVAAAPANNNFANSILISAASGNATGTNVSATKETGEPSHAGNAGGRSVWWKWVAPSNNPVTFDLSASTFDTLIGIYTGSAVNALTTIASDDDSGATDRSLVTFTPVSGTTYHIAVDGYSLPPVAAGNIGMTWSTQVLAAADADWALYE